MRLIGDYLNERGLTVSAPLLPGHGTVPEDLNRVRWTDWTEAVEAELRKLQGGCEAVFVGGLSLGALLTLYLAAHHPELPGAMVYSPALIVANRLSRLVPLGKYFIRLFPKRPKDSIDPTVRERSWSYRLYPTFGVHESGKLIREVRRVLPRIVSPLLIVHSLLDADIRPQSARLVYDTVGSADKELLMLNYSGHSLTVDREWELVAERTYRFIEARGPRSGSGPSRV